MLLAEIILPLPTMSNYSYRIKDEHLDMVAEGKRVLAPFGKNKTYTGVIKRLYEAEENEDNKRLRFVIEVCDEYPILFDLQYRLFEWIAFYYMCTEGEVLKAALPIGLKPKSNQFVVLADTVSDIDELLEPEIEQTLFGEEKHYDVKFDDKEITLLMALFERGELFVEEIGELWEIDNPQPRLKKLEERGVIRIKQKMEEKYKPKVRTYLHLKEEYKNEQKLNAVFETLHKAPAQENLLLRIVSEYFQGKALAKNEILKELKISPASANALIEKGIIEETAVQVERMPILENTEPLKEITLNDTQQVAYDEIMMSFTEDVQKPVLLHGITGSGKTHIYTTLMKEYLKQGKQILYLLPEISITQQIIQRVKRELGNTVGVYHSRFNDNERVEIWHKVCTRQYDVVIGVRSAIFLPFENLGLIIVDEEHDRSFKQDDPAPRYNSRDLAIWLARQSNCPILLGSATPSFETYYNALIDKYKLVNLHQRAIAAQLPEMQIVDMRIETKQKTVKGVFSSVLRDAMQTALEKGEQVILFQNRRGYSPFLQCTNCGHIPQCINCDISLTYHKEKNYAKCHYCSHVENLDTQCPSCGNQTLRKQGAGTERIEEQVQELFPDYKVQRMDLDTTRGKSKFQQLIQKLEKKEIDVLVGTQMVSKGLDFENVTLVGIINADNSLSYPDFRVYETAYQMLTQVSGRAGRSRRKGRVVIQTMMPKNDVLQSLTGTYQDFYNLIIKSREELNYPPFSRLIRIELQHSSEQFMEEESRRFKDQLAPIFGDSLLGPDYLPVARIRNIYRMQCLIKINKKANPYKIRESLIHAIDNYYRIAPSKTLRVMLDIDPY